MIANQIKALVEPYLIVDPKIAGSAFDSPSFGVYRGTNLRATPYLEATLSLLSGGECANFIAGELVIQVHPMSLLSLKTSHDASPDDSGISIDLRSIRFTFREKGREWRESKGDGEMLDAKLAVFQALRTAVHDALMLEQSQHDTLASGWVKVLVSRVARNVRVDMSDIKIDMFPDSSDAEAMILSVASITIASSSDDPCYSHGFGHVQGSSVFRKVLTLQELCTSYRGSTILCLDTIELSVAANLSTEGVGLCTAIDLRLGETHVNLGREAYGRINGIAERLNEGLKLEQATTDAIMATISHKVFKPEMDDTKRIIDTYERILQSDAPDNDPDLAVPSDDTYGLARPVTWLQVREMQLGEMHVSKLLKEASDNVKSKRARETEKASRGIIGFLPTFGLRGSDKLKRGDKVTVIESLHLLRQDSGKVRLVFESLDVDGSGYIDISELQRGLENCGLNLGTKRVKALMRDIDQSSDGRISFDEFKAFLYRVDDENDLGEDSVVSVALVIFAQSLVINIGSAMGVSVEGATLAMSSSGMPYFRRHDYTVGLKKSFAHLDRVRMTSLRTKQDFMRWGNEWYPTNDNRELQTRNSIKFVEFRPSENYQLANADQSEEKGAERMICVACDYLDGLGAKHSHIGGRGVYDAKTQRVTFSTSASPLVETNSYLIRDIRSKRTDVYKIRLFNGLSDKTNQSLLSRWLNLSRAEDEDAPLRDEDVISEVDLMLPRPSLASVEFARGDRVLQTSERWLACVDGSTGAKIGDLLLLVSSEAWLISESLPKNDIIAHLNDDFSKSDRALQFDLVHSPGIQLSDLAISLHMKPMAIEYSKDAATCLSDAGLILSIEATSSTGHKPGHAVAQATKESVKAAAIKTGLKTELPTTDTNAQLAKSTAIAPSNSNPTPNPLQAEPNPQQVATPGDLFGFSTYTSLDAKSPTVPSLIRASIILRMFDIEEGEGTTVTLERDPGDENVLTTHVRPFTLHLETNGGCSPLVSQLVGFEPPENRKLIKKSGGSELLGRILPQKKPVINQEESKFESKSSDFSYRQVDQPYAFHQASSSMSTNDAQQQSRRTGRGIEEEKQSVGGESFVTALEDFPDEGYDEEYDAEASGFEYALNREFHMRLWTETKSSMSLGGIELAISITPKRSSEEKESKPLLSFGIVQPVMTMSAKLDPFPRAQFAFTFNEITLVDQAAKIALLGRVVPWSIFERKAAYPSPLPPMTKMDYRVNSALSDTNFSEQCQLAIRGEYSPRGTSFSFNLDGLYIFATPILALVTEVTDSIPQALDQSPSPPQKTPSSAVSTDPSSSTDYNTTLVLPTRYLEATLTLNRFELYVFSAPTMSRALEQDKIRTLCMRAKSRGNVDIQSRKGGGAVPKHENARLNTTCEVVRLDLRKSKNVNRLVDPFLVELTFSTQRADEMDVELRPSQEPLVKVVQQALDRRFENLDEMPVAQDFDAPPPDIVQDVVLVIDGGFNARMDSNDFKFCIVAMTTLTEATTSTRQIPPNGFNQPALSPSLPSPEVQSLVEGRVGDGSSAGSDIGSIWSIMSSLYPLFVLSGSDTPISRIEDDEKVVDIRRRLAQQAQEAYRSSAGPPPIQRARVILGHFLLGVGVLGENGFPTPFLRVHLAEAKMTVESRSNTWFKRDVEGTGSLVVEAQTFNTISHAWEPLIEPWRVRMGAKVTEAEETLITVFADARLNVNITESVVFNLAKFSYFIDPSSRPLREDMRLKGPFCPNWVVNETGEDLQVWPVRDEKVVPSRGSNDSKSVNAGLDNTVPFREDGLQGKRKAPDIIAKSKERKSGMTIHSSRSQDDAPVKIEADQVRQIHLRDRRSLFEAGDRLVDRYIFRKIKEARQKKEKVDKYFDRQALLKDIFQLIDRDGNGSLSVSELQRALATQDEIIPRDQLEYEIEIALGKSSHLSKEGVSKEDFAMFFSRARDREFAVSALGLCIPSVAESETDFFLAPPNMTGVYVLPSQDASRRASSPISVKGCELFAVVEKMGRLVVASVTRIETRIKVENRLAGYTILIGYYGISENNEAEPQGARVRFDPDPEKSLSMATTLDKQSERQEKSFLGRWFPSLSKDIILANSGSNKRDQAAATILNKGETGLALRNQQPRFIVVHRIEPGESKSVPVRFFRQATVTDFVARIVPQLGDTQSTSPDTRQQSQERENDGGDLFFETPVLMKLGSDREDIPIHSMRTSKKTEVKDEDQLFSVLQIESRPDDILQSELVDANLVRADQLRLTKGRQMTISERTVPTRQFLCKAMLTLQVIHGRKLLAADLNGLSDPYVVVTAGKETFRTPTMSGTLEPRWPEKDSTFKLGQYSSVGDDEELPEDILIEVFDEDRLRRDDSLGKIRIKTSDLIEEIMSDGSENRSLVRTYALEGKSKSGELRLGWIYEPKANFSIRSKIHQRVLAFSHSFTIDNLLPVTLEVELSTQLDQSQSNDNDREPVKLREIYVLGAGKACIPGPYYDAARLLTESVGVRVRITDTDGWTPVEVLHRPLLINSVRGTFIITNDLVREKDGTWTLIFFADVWVANKAGSDMQICLDIPPIGTGPYGELVLTEGMLPPIRTSLLHENQTMCISFPRNRSNDRKDVVVRGHFASSKKEFVSVDPKAILAGRRYPIKARVKPVNLDDAKVQANEGLVMLQASESLATSLLTETHMPWSYFGRASKSQSHSRELDGDLLIVFHRIKRPDGTSQQQDGQSSMSDFLIPKEVRLVDLDDGTFKSLDSLDQEHFIVRKADIQQDKHLCLQVVSSEPVGEPRSWKLNLADVESFLANKSRDSSKGLMKEFWCFFDFDFGTSHSQVKTDRSALQCGVVVHNAGLMEGELEHAHSGRGEAERLSVGTTSLYGKWFRTRLCTFAPMFTVAREFALAHHILAKPAGAHDSESILLSVVPLPLRFCDAMKPAVQFRLASYPGAAWTLPVPLMHDHDFSIQLRDADGRRLASFLFDVNRSGPSRCIVARNNPDALTRVIVRNNSDKTIFVRQIRRPPRRSWTDVLSCKSVTPGSISSAKADQGALKKGQSYSFPWDEIPPRAALPMPFDIFDDVAQQTDSHNNNYLHSSRIMVSASPQGHTSFRKEDDASAQPLDRSQTSNTSMAQLVCKLRDGFVNDDNKVFQVRCESRGARLVVNVENYPTLSARNGNEQRVLAHQLSSSSSQPHDQKAVDVFNLAVQLAGVGVSLYSSTKRNEVMYMLLQRIHFESSTFTRMERDLVEGPNAVRPWTTSKTELAIAKMQMDSSLPQAKYPVSLTSAIELDARKRKKIFSSALKRRYNLGETHKHFDSDNASEAPPPIVTPIMEVWAPKLCGAEARKRRSDESFFRLVAHSANPAGMPEAVIYKNVEATIRSLDVRMDEVFLGGLLSVLLAQADASAFSNSTIVDAAENSPVVVRSVSKADATLLQTCFEQDLTLPARDSSFVEAAYVSGWTVTLTVKLGSPEELIPLAKRYGIPVNLLGIAIRLSRLEALLFDLPNFPERDVGSEKIVTNYSALFMSAFWQQLGEVLFNVAKRLFISTGIMKGLTNTEKVRKPPEPSDVVTSYGPGSLPQSTEVLIETAAVRRIEAWWTRRKQVRGMTNEGISHPEAQKKSPRARLAEMVSFHQAGGKKKEEKKRCTPSGCL